MDTLIEADRVSLRFAAPTEKKGSLKKWVLDALRGRVGHRHFLAVDDVSFSIRRGETVGLVGRNGAGKSTLLKLVTGIVEPTGGSMAVRGQVAPLLALGNGLDPRLTGRENIYLNGAILGYEKAYLQEKEKSIIDFSELDGFIDAPVRTYSSGMTMRLAFSIATAATPEILILDEVLAVGDAAFQAKCRARMSEIIEDGATVFFVSHSLGDVRQLCSRAIWLDKGRIVMDGPSSDVCPAFEEYSKTPFLPPALFLHGGLPEGCAPVAMFRNVRNGRVVLVSDRSEMQNISEKLPSWSFRGVPFLVREGEDRGTVPLVRFLNLADGRHAFAAGESAAAPFLADRQSWKFEKVLGHVFYKPVPDSVPVSVSNALDGSSVSVGGAAAPDFYATPAPGACHE